jgi:hypothetical protein
MGAPATAARLRVAEAGVGALGAPGGRVAASGAGWAWLRDPDGRPLHVTGERGPRGPLTAIVGRVPVLHAGDRVALDPADARPWRTPAPPPPAPPDRRREALLAVAAHVWNDPWARALGRDELEDLLPHLVGRGPGLTPAGDDALLGFILARMAVDAHGARPRVARILAAARRGTGGPSVALLRHAARGEAAEPAARMRDALLRADGPAIAPALRGLLAFGRTTGRAILAGLAAGLDPQ